MDDLLKLIDWVPPTITCSFMFRAQATDKKYLPRPVIWDRPMINVFGTIQTAHWKLRFNMMPTLSFGGTVARCHNDRQPSVPPVSNKLASLQLSVFSVIINRGNTWGHQNQPTHHKLTTLKSTLQWRHNERIASQITCIWAVCSAVCSGVHQRKHQRSKSLAFPRGIPRWPVDSTRDQ